MHTERRRAAKAIGQKWPTRMVRQFSEVARFGDPGDWHAGGRPRPVIDLVTPWARLLEATLQEFVTVGIETGHRVRRLVAALAATYGGMIPASWSDGRRGHDAVDFRPMVRAKFHGIRRDELRRLAGQVWRRGGGEGERFLGIALGDEPFPV